MNKPRLEMNNTEDYEDLRVLELKNYLSRIRKILKDFVNMPNWKYGSDVGNIIEETIKLRGKILEDLKPHEEEICCFSITFWKESYLRESRRESHSPRPSLEPPRALLRQWAHDNSLTWLKLRKVNKYEDDIQESRPPFAGYFYGKYYFHQ